MGIVRTIHLLAAVIWIGGMFFAYFALRPAASGLDPATRLTLWKEVLERFFLFVWVAATALLVTGYWMLFAMGGFAAVGLYVHLMNLLGLVMAAIFLHVWFAPFQRLRRAVAASNFPWAGEQLHQIRFLVALNLAIGVVVVAVAGGFRYLG